MKIPKKYANIFNKFSKFLLVGGFVSILDWFFYYVLLYKLNIYYVISTIISYTICTIISLLFTHSFVFNLENNPSTKETFSTFLASGIALLLTTLLMYIGGEFTSLNKMFLRILVTGIVLIYNFSVRYFIIYQKSQ